jgi:hypothetical protein
VDCGIVYLYIVTPFLTFRLMSLFIDTKLVVIENTFRGAVQNVTRDDVCETVAASALTLRPAPYFFFFTLPAFYSFCYLAYIGL